MDIGRSTRIGKIAMMMERFIGYRIVDILIDAMIMELSIVEMKNPNILDEHRMIGLDEGNACR